jgi:hypothetical protein
MEACDCDRFERQEIWQMALQRESRFGSKSAES